MRSKDWYLDLVHEIFCTGRTQFNERTQSHVTVLANQFLSVPVTDRLPVARGRRIYPHVAAAELAWTLSGEKSIEWLSTHTKMWDKFADENGDVPSAYGYRWRRYWQRDQLEDAIKALCRDSSSRQVVVMAWDPEMDGLLNQGRLSNVPCPLGFVLNVTGLHLNMTLFIRSSDVIVGLPYDVLHYGLLLDAITMELYQRGHRLYRGTLGVCISHAHIYSVHDDLARIMDTETQSDAEPIGWPTWSVSDILADPDKYVAEVKQAQKGRLCEYVYPVEAVA